MIDFGLAHKIIYDSKHIPEKKTKSFVGTAGFSSINSHLLVEQTRRDDLEGLVYVMLYLYGGPLPWHNIDRGLDRQERYNQIVERKFKANIEEIIQ